MKIREWLSDKSNLKSVIVGLLTLLGSVLLTAIASKVVILVVVIVCIVVLVALCVWILWKIERNPEVYQSLGAVAEQILKYCRIADADKFQVIHDGGEWNSIRIKEFTMIESKSSDESIALLKAVEQLMRFGYATKGTAKEDSTYYILSERGSLRAKELPVSDDEKKKVQECLAPPTPIFQVINVNGDDRHWKDVNW
jgi:hypothetical protein